MILRARIGKSEGSEKRKTKLENQNNRRIGTELWITTPIILFSDVLLIGPFWVLTYLLPAVGERRKGEWELKDLTETGFQTALEKSLAPRVLLLPRAHNYFVP